MSSNHILLICTNVLFFFWSDVYFDDYRSNSGFDIYDDCGLDRLSTYGAMNAVSTSFPAKVTNCTENKTIYNLGKANIKLEVSLHHIIKINMLDASNKKTIQSSFLPLFSYVYSSISNKTRSSCTESCLKCQLVIYSKKLKISIIRCKPSTPSVPQCRQIKRDLHSTTYSVIPLYFLHCL